jgi:hypothetical protein
MSNTFMSVSELADREFVDNLYNIMLGRDPDPSGLAAVQWQLTNGVTREAIFLQVAKSREFQHRFAAYRKAAPSLPNLIAKRPDRYSRSGDFVIFTSASSEDYDWLENAIIEYRFYERPGPWGYGIDRDKVVLASFAASLGLKDMFEMGCGDGSVLACVERLGMSGSGLDISSYARSCARPEVREKILLGDLLETDDVPRAELTCAFDLIEHISPNKIDRFLSKLCSVVDHEGVVVFNTPAFGNDRIFGLVHGYWIQEWRAAHQRGQLWRSFPCDEMGFPLMGHLIWADSIWWEALFERHGLHRLDLVERSLHAKFDRTMDYSAARKSYFVLSRDAGAERVRALCAAIERFDLERACASCDDLIAR